MDLETIKEVCPLVCGLAFAVGLISLVIWGQIRQHRQKQVDYLHWDIDGMIDAWKRQQGPPAHALVLDVSPVEELGLEEFARRLKQGNSTYTDEEIEGLFRVCQEMENLT